jgi:hypothetical protein
MYLPFESMPGHSRVWIYQANRRLTTQEGDYLVKGLRNLCDQWAAHGVPLRTSYTFQFGQFIILAVDDGASGCSIDDSVHQLQGFQQKLGIDLFDRSQVAFRQADQIVLHPLKELKHLFEGRTLTADTIAFNNLVSTKDEWEKQWQAPVRESWLSRHLPKSVVAG